MRAAAKILGWPIVFFIGMATMIYGWGLEPQSWLWIVGGHFTTVFILVLTDLIPE